jgi:hypothetical protein
MTRLTSVGGSFTAHVIAARLEAEGIAVKLRGAVDSPYQFTVGDIGRVDVFVAEEDVPDARVVLLIDEVDATLDLPPQKEAPAGGNRRTLWLAWVALVLLAVVPAADLAMN